MEAEALMLGHVPRNWAAGRSVLEEERVSSAPRSKHQRKLFSVMGWISSGHTVPLIIDESEAAAEHYAFHDLGFLKVDRTILLSDCVHIGSVDTER